MKLSLVSWNGTNINNGSPFTAFIPRGQMASLNYNPVLTPRADDYPALSSAVKQGSVLVIGIIVAAGNNINTNRELLKRYFFSDQEKHNLIAQDEADSNKQYFRSVSLSG
jgi:aryl-alcohol dehydrogenase-like predicted oxidoreductase